MKRNETLRVKTPAPPRHIGEAVGSKSDRHMQTGRSDSKNEGPSRNTSTRSGRVSPLSAPASPVHSSCESLVWALKDPEPVVSVRKPGSKKKPSQHHLRDSQLLGFAEANSFAMGFRPAGPSARQPLPPQPAKTHAPRAKKAAPSQEQWTDIPLGNAHPTSGQNSRGPRRKGAYSYSRHNDAFQQLTRAEAGRMGPHRTKRAVAKHVDSSAPTTSKAGSNAWILGLLIVGIVAFGALLIGLLVGKKADSK